MKQCGVRNRDGIPYVCTKLAGHRGEHAWVKGGAWTVWPNHENPHGSRWQVCWAETVLPGRDAGRVAVWLVYKPGEREPHTWFHMWENAITYVDVMTS